MKISDVVSSDHDRPDPQFRGRIVWEVQRQLAVRPSLLQEPYRSDVEAGAHPLTGHCYNASVVLQSLLGMEWTPRFLEHEGVDHWYLAHRQMNRIVGATAVQFLTPVPYRRADPRSFMPQEPSQRLREVIDWVEGEL